MVKPYALHVAHTAYGQALCAMVKPYALYIAHMA